MHFVFTIQIGLLTSLSHAVRKIFGFQRLSLVHKVLAKACWIAWLVFMTWDSGFTQTTWKGFKIFTGIKNPIKPAAEMAHNQQTSHPCPSLTFCLCPGGFTRTPKLWAPQTFCFTSNFKRRIEIRYQIEDAFPKVERNGAHFEPPARSR